MIKSVTFANINALVYIPDNACGIAESGGGLVSQSTDGVQQGLPMMVFLHGIGEQGDTVADLAKIQKLPPLSLAEQQKFPFIIISPQLKKSYGSWPVKYIHSVIQYGIDAYKPDITKIYLAGISLGGGGVWSYAQTTTIPYTVKGATIQVPRVKLAAIVPCCGYQNSPSKAVNVDMPVYAFHGMADGTVDISITIRMLNALVKVGKNPLHTFYPDTGHNCWGKAFSVDHTYQNPNIYEWLQLQKLN